MLHIFSNFVASLTLIFDHSVKTVEHIYRYWDNSIDLQNFQPQLTRKHISQARYEVRLPIFIRQPFYKFVFLKEVSTDEKHIFQCASGTTRYTIPFPLKPAKKYEINVFCGSCDGPGRFTLVAHPTLKFQAGIWRCISRFMCIMFCFICLICHACIKMIIFLCCFSHGQESTNVVVQTSNSILQWSISTPPHPFVVQEQTTSVLWQNSFSEWWNND